MARLRIGFVHVVGLFVVAACLAITGLDAWRTWQARGTQLAEGERAASNLARSIAQHALGTFNEADAVLIGLVDRLQSGGSSPESIEQIHAVLVRYAGAMAQFQRLSVIGSDGRWLTTSLSKPTAAVDVSDRQYFRFHKTSSSSDAYLGPLIQSKSTGEWIVTLSRRFNRPDGSFGGLVLASIDVGYFGRFYAGFDIGEHGSLHLASASGNLLQRRPHVEQLVGMSFSGNEFYRHYIAKMPKGSATLVSPIDGIERQIAFQNLDEYPLYVVAALSTAETLAVWEQDAIVHTAFVLLLTIGLGISGFWVVVQINRRGVVQSNLLQSQREMALLNAQLTTLAREDGLTGLVNRRELDRVLLAEVNRARRHGAPLAFVLLDVDFFKAFNDRYGHVAGDQCLRRVAAVLGSCANRPGDLVARYGGEEFALVLPSIDAEGAVVVADKVLAAVRDLGIGHLGSPLGVVTMSAGVAVLGMKHVDGSPNDLIEKADSALYRAKIAGRARTAVWTSTVRPAMAPTRQLASIA